MSTVWKWILAILGLLIVLGLIAGAVFMWRNQGFQMSARVSQPWSLDRTLPPNGPGTPDGYREYRRYHMDEWGGGMPMMGYQQGYSPYAFGPFGPGLMLVGGLFHMLLPLGVLALVAYIFYQMGKRAGLTAASGSTADAESTPRRRAARS